MFALYAATLAVALGSASCSNANGNPENATPSPSSGSPAARAPLTAEEKQFYQQVAQDGWRYMQSNADPKTGLVRATPDWQNTTLWDIGAQMLAYLAARDLGLLKPEEYRTRTAKVLNTVERMPLFRDVAYNKIYSTQTGSFGSEGRVGWSATDLGRFLLALKIVAARDPEFAAQAERVARRNKFDQIVKDGYLHGQLLGTGGKPWTFQEGRIGYEQYAASGFAAWGVPVQNALNVNANAEPADVLGVKILADKRYQDRLVSEPFILQGIETGLSGDMLQLARNVLQAQEARYKSTGSITIASEDAVGIPPHYFYYYCVYCSRKPFVIDIAVPDKSQDSPRWVSTKATFGWHAVLPNEYTKRALDYIAPARDAKKGWSSGVFEGTRKSTNTYDINTAAVLLEAAAFQLRGGRPLNQ